MNNNEQKNNIEIAQESRFNAAHYNEALTAFSSGYNDPENLKDLLEFIAPAVPVSRRFEFKKAKNAEAFLSEDDDVRAIGSSFKRIQYSGETVYSKTHNKGLTIRIDHDEVAGEDWQERYVQLLIQRLLRNELRRAIAILNTAAATSKQKWNKNSNPDGDLRKTLRAAADKSGIRPNRILFGESAWDLRANAYEHKENAAALRSADLSPKEIASKLLADRAEVLRARYQSSADSKSQILDNAVFAYYAQSDITKDEPSNLKRFITPTQDGMFRVYTEEHPKYTDITVEHYSNIVVTSEIGIQKLEIEE